MILKVEIEYRTNITLVFVPQLDLLSSPNNDCTKWGTLLLFGIDKGRKIPYIENGFYDDIQNLIFYTLIGLHVNLVLFEKYYLRAL